MPRPDFGDDQHAPTAIAAPSGRPDFGDQHPAAAGGGDWTGTAEKLLGATGATIGGLGKGAVQSFGNAPWASIPNEDGKSPVLNWAKTEDKNYPVAEKAGRYAAQYGPLAIIPSVGLEGLAAKAIPEFPRAASIIGKGLEGTWKGAVGGATQGDAKTGAATGGGTAAAYNAYRMLPHQAQWMLPVAAIMAMSKAGGEGYIPWDTRHILSYLAEAAAGLTGKLPGVAGALGAKAFGEGGK
jgi:hypothetical protein